VEHDIAIVVDAHGVILQACIVVVMGVDATIRRRVWKATQIGIAIV
jgi:hypothetical protein